MSIHYKDQYFHCGGKQLSFFPRTVYKTILWRVENPRFSE